MIRSLFTNKKVQIPKPTRRLFESGQSLMEFALMFVILSVILMGVFDLARAYFTYLALLDAAGEGATYGSVNPSAWCNNASSTTTYPGGCAGFVGSDPNNITYRVLNSAPSGTLVDWTQAQVNVELENPTDPVKPTRKISVTVTTSYKLLTPFVSTLVGNQSLQLKGTAESVVLAP